jgi:subtilase family serine protease
MHVREFAKVSVFLGLAAIGPAALIAGNAPARVHHVSPQLAIGAEAVPAAEATPAFGLFRCQVGLTPGELCYDPYEMRRAYGTDTLIAAGFDGTGRTIVIIDAFQSPPIASDLAAFSAFYGLPQANFTIVAPDGLTPFDFSANQRGWAGEITLDVEWSHAIAPNANIVLVLAKSNDDADILSALNYAVNNNLGDVISMSFGENESCLDPAIASGYHAAFAKATLQGTTLFASSGDQGAAQPTCDGKSWVLSASSPASDPLVSGVGGTTLTASDYVCGANNLCSGGGVYQSEIAWNELFCANAACNLLESEATGGGISVVFDAPPWQRANPKTAGRAVPDVAYNADTLTGVITVWTQPLANGTYRPQSFFLFGGTSAGSPQWAAIAAIADQVAGHRLGFLNSAFSQIGRTLSNYGPSFHDVVGNDNSVLELDSSNNDVEVDGFPAVTGFDETTGFGSPKVDGIVGRLIAFTLTSDGPAAVAASKPHAQGKGASGAMQPH